MSRCRGWPLWSLRLRCSRWRWRRCRSSSLRSGMLEIEPALATFAAALIFAALAVLLAFAGYVSDLAARPRRASAARCRACCWALLLLAYPGYLAYKAAASCRPSTTSPPTPTTRRASTCWRACARAAATTIRAPRPRRCSTTAYPDIAPLLVDVPPQASPTTSRSTWSPSANGMWSTRSRRCRAGATATIEAVARTLIMGFRDDVVIRVSANGTGARIDMRSASRYGVHDFGANAKRVQALLDGHRRCREQRAGAAAGAGERDSRRRSRRPSGGRLGR